LFFCDADEDAVGDDDFGGRDSELGTSAVEDGDVGTDSMLAFVEAESEKVTKLVGTDDPSVRVPWVIKKYEESK
jgi:hypothetical protein